MNTGVIHTKSSYAEGLTVSITNDKQENLQLYIDAYMYLYNQEKMFYQSFFKGVNTLEEFLERIRKIFADAEKDAEYLKRFTNSKLSRFNPEKQPYFFERDLKLIVHADKGKELFKNFKGKTKDFEYYAEDTIAINIDMEHIQEIRRVLNTFSKRQGNSLFADTGVVSTDLLNVLENQKFNKEIFQIVGDSQVKGPTTKEFNIRDVSQKKFNKDKIKYLQAHINEPGNRRELEVIQYEMRQALTRMGEFMFSQLDGCSTEMRESVKTIWQSVVPTNPDFNMLQRTFFFEGDNIIKALYGNPGEFTNAVLLEYLRRKSDVDNPILIKIIGNIFDGGEQPRSDIQIMTELGANINFQTKNIEDTGTITTNSTLELILPNFNEEGIADILVNHFANTTYGGKSSLDSIKELLSERFYQAMNLNIQEGLDKFQTNTFYFVGGDKLIPGSQIIRHIYLRPTKPSFEITGASVTKDSDTGYRENFSSYNYWKYPKGSKNPSKDEMEATEKNISAFSEAQSNIRISTSFSINALISSRNFRIFN